MTARRSLFDPEHDLFRDSFRAFLKNEVLPHYAKWEENGIVDREIYLKAGAQGFLGMGIPEQYGGVEGADYRYNAIVSEEIARHTVRGLGPWCGARRSSRSR